MNHNHHSSHCSHAALHFCACCNVVYCANCHQEWRQHSWPQTYPWVTYTNVAGNTGGLDPVPVTVTCQHGTL